MENKKMKLWKKILLIVLPIFILFSIYVFRNFILISNMENIAKEYSSKTNYIANVYSIHGNSVNVSKSYYKDGKSISLIQIKLNDVNDTHKLTIYKNGNEGIGVIESAGKKTAILNENILGGAQVVTFGMFGTDLNILNKLFLSIVARITTEQCNNNQTFLVEMPDGWKMWVDKGNGTIVREINGGFVTERNYEFDVVKDTDIVKPDISDCEIQK